MLDDTFNYSIGRFDLIEWVDDAWLRFAQLSGATGLTRAAVIGTSIWDFVSGAKTQSLYRAIFSQVRFEYGEIKIPFRCDSPHLLRFMELDVKASSRFQIQLCGKLLWKEKRRPALTENNRVTHLEPGFEMCSLCKRVHAFGQWIEPEVAAQKFDVFNATYEQKVLHSVCDLCIAQFRYCWTQPLQKQGA